MRNGLWDTRDCLAYPPPDPLRTAEKRWQRRPSPQTGHTTGKMLPCVVLPSSGAHARFDIAREAFHNALHLGDICGHDVEHHVAHPTICIAPDVVLDRCRATRQELARGAAAIGK